ncbi:MAG: HD domain-containing protein [Patescibacteria group bacterium]
MKNQIKKIEQYVQKISKSQTTHDYDHVDRVRQWAVLIAKKEKYPDLKMVEIAALMHDIGRPFVTNQREHGRAGAKIAGQYLRRLKILSEDKTKKVEQAIAEHNTGGKGQGLTAILKDADILDLLGTIGIIRACDTCTTWLKYDPHNIKGPTWKLDSLGFNKRFAKGQGVGQYLVDELNFQASCLDNVATPTAKKIARPLAKLMTNFIKQLEKEVTHHI